MAANGSYRKKRKAQGWYSERKYLHFDRPLGYKAALKATSPTDVAIHSFYPLISYEVESVKVQKDEDTKKLVQKNKTRPIMYAAHLDSHIYSRYAYDLSGEYEKALATHGLSDCVLAFRALGKDNIDFALQAFEYIKSKHSCCAIALDVRGFFNNLDHEVLKNAWCNVLDKDRLPEDHFAIFKSITKYSNVSKTDLFDLLCISSNNPKNGRVRVCMPKEFREVVRSSGLIQRNRDSYGIPQGTPISAVLSNIYMLAFDIAVKSIAKSAGGIYLRYCDDMLLVVPINKKASVENEVFSAIKQIKLDINADKTEVRIFSRYKGILRSDKPLQYLGFVFDGERILLRSSSLARYSDKMRRGVRLAKATMRKRNIHRVRRGADVNPLYRKKLYGKYSHLGACNFVSYGYRAASKMDSQSIRNQLKPLWARLQSQIDR